jgi:hypothetical protein
MRVRYLAAAAACILLAGFGTPVRGAAGDDASIVWLCRPGMANNPCTKPLDATVIVDGKVQGIEHAARAASPQFDCFYIYPSVSPETGTNASLVAGKQLDGVATDQVSRFSPVCNVWSPVYRQITESMHGVHRYDEPALGATAYASVLPAWRDYLTHYNAGRPIIFIGHSQGTQMLQRLIRQEVDPNPALRNRIVVAILLGGNVAIANSPNAQGSFKNFPGCRSVRQLGCVIAYSAFPGTPPADTRFGVPGVGVSLQGEQFETSGVSVVCTNPAALSGGSARLDTYLRTVPEAYSWAPADTAPPNVTTPWVEYRGAFSGECRHQGKATWLNITRNVAANPWPHLIVESPVAGLHAYDMLIALGNLIEDVKAKEAAFNSK